MSARRASIVSLGALVALAVAAPAASGPAAAPPLAVTIVSPASGATVRGPVRFAVRHRGAAPQRVEFLVNGRLRHVDRSPPFTYRAGGLRPAELQPGRNTLRVVAHRGNVRAAHAIHVFLPRPPPRNGLLGTDPGFFPIAVWMQQPNLYAAQLKGVGVNVFHGLWHPPGPSNERMAALRRHDMVAVVQGDHMQQALRSSHPERVVAWHHQDEPDNAQWTGSGWGPCVQPQVIIDRYRRWKAADPTRPVVVNFGFGAAHTTWIGRGSCTGRTDMYVEYQKGADIVGFDVYPVNEGWPITLVADGVDNLIRWTSGRKPVWAFVETTRYHTGNGTPTPSQTRAQVWLALTHGATGIQYFAHTLTPTFSEVGLLQDAMMAAEVARTNDQIRRLARVLNSPTIRNGASVAAAGRIDHVVKRVGGVTYLFAVNPGPEPIDAVFTVAGVTGGTAAVIDESRSLTLAGGRFGDRFGPYGVRLYRIAASP